MVKIKHSGFTFEISEETAKKFVLSEGQDIECRYKFERVIKFDRTAQSEQIRNEAKQGQKKLF